MSLVLLPFGRRTALRPAFGNGTLCPFGRVLGLAFPGEGKPKEAAIQGEVPQGNQMASDVAFAGHLKLPKDNLYNSNGLQPNSNGLPLIAMAYP